MSIKVMTYVWDKSKRSGTELLLLLALADHCNDEGECYPGIKRLAKKCRTTERTVQRTLAKLVEAGELQVDTQRGYETKFGRTNLYRIIRVTRTSPGDTEGVTSTSPGDIGGSEGVTPVSPEGVTPVSPKPSVQPSVETNILTSTQQPQQPEYKREWVEVLVPVLFGHKRFDKLKDRQWRQLHDVRIDLEGECQPSDVLGWYETVWTKQWPGLQKNGATQQPSPIQVTAGMLKWMEGRAGAKGDDTPPANYVIRYE